MNDPITPCGILNEAITPTIDNTYAEVVEIEKHLHNREKWFGAATVPVGETHVADRAGGGISPFELTTGNDDFGTWVQIIGSDDTPVSSGFTKMDAHRAIVVDTDSTNMFIIQIATGESADLAAKIASEAFTEFPYISASNLNDSGISDVLTIRADVGTKVWARACCIGANAKMIHVYYGIHEYLQ